jgi:serine/threonine protein kinase
MRSGVWFALLNEFVLCRAPELLVENSRYDEKVDVWSVGCIFGELCRSKPLFRGGCRVFIFLFFSFSFECGS